jgi:hypothetical protein
MAGYQIYLKVSAPYETTEAKEVTVRDSYSTTALVLRDEKVIPMVNRGTVSYLFNDVAKVTEGMAVAEIYESYEQVALKHRIALLDEEIKMISEADDPGVTEVANLDSINRLVLAQIKKLGETTIKGVVGSVSEIKNELTKQLSKKQIITGLEENFIVRQTALEAEKAELEGQFRLAKPQIITAPESGYFIGYSDGYESSLTAEYAQNMTLDVFDMFMEGQNQDVADPAQTVGKVISNYNWYIAYPVSNDSLSEFRKGASYNLNFLSIGVNDIQAKISDIITEKDEDRSLIIFKSNLMSSELATVRFPEIEIVFRSYDGLQVPASALHYSNEKGYTGVYVQEASVIRFKKVEPVFQNERFVVSEINQLDSSRLQLFDKVIISGKDLYDGKPLE